MIANVLVAIFIAIALMDQSSAYSWEEYFEKEGKCSKMFNHIPREHYSNYLVRCWLSLNDIVNHEGEINISKMEGIVKDLFMDTEKRGVAIKGLYECAEKVLGQNKVQILEKFSKCWMASPARRDMIEEHKRYLARTHNQTTEPSHRFEWKF